MAVFQEFLTEILAAKGRVKLVLWVRASAVAERNAFKSRLREILSDADARQISFEVIAVDDARASDKLHRRSLLTIKGGIGLEQGFQELTNGKTIL